MRVLSLLLALTLTSCLSNGSKTASIKTGADTSSNDSITPTPAGSVTAPLTIRSDLTIPSKTDSRPIFIIPVIRGGSSSSSVTSSLLQYCASTTSCECHFEWLYPGETALASGQPRHSTNTTASSAPSQTLFQCNALSGWNKNQFPAGTQMSVSIIQMSTRYLVTDKHSFSVSPVNVPGQFVDEARVPFSNIRRYSCYEKNNTPTTLMSKMLTAYTPKDTGSGQTGSNPVITPSATQFCYRRKNVGGDSDSTPKQPDNCPNVDTDARSVKSFYYSLYVPDHKKSSINAFNELYECPKVGTETSSDFYPLDTTFALRQERGSDFNVPVVSASVLGNGSSATTHQTCDAPETTPNANSTTSILSRCMGYAKKAEPNGTCSPIKVLSPSCGSSATCTDTVSKPTFRLRKYIAVYPQSFNPNGSVVNEPRAADVVYVLDRPFTASATSTQITGTILGPKPCPFAYFDIAGTINGYDSCLGGDRKDSMLSSKTYATNDACWKGKNPDGTSFPYFDRYSNSYSEQTPASQPMCGALLPVVKRTDDGTINGVYYSTTYRTEKYRNPAVVDDYGTAHRYDEAGATGTSLDRVYIRPMRPWSPHYEEDTSFQACAPLPGPNANSFEDAPLHLAKYTVPMTRLNAVPRTIASWCSAIYPNQADVTSNGVTGSRNTQPANGIARKIANSNSGKLEYAPLQAPQREIASMLRADPSYGCTISTMTPTTATLSSYKQAPVDPQTRVGYALTAGCCKLTGNSNQDLAPDLQSIGDPNKAVFRETNQRCEMPYGTALGMP